LLPTARAVGEQGAHLVDNRARGVDETRPDGGAAQVNAEEVLRVAGFAHACTLAEAACFGMSMEKAQPLLGFGVVQAIFGLIPT
jgi:hypothetical protein